MNRSLCFMAVLAMAAPVAASSFGLPNELTNGGFESGNLNGWQIAPERTGVDFPGGGEQREGNVAFREIQGYYGEDRPAGHLWQDIPVDQPGLYAIDFSGWVKRYVLDDSFALRSDWGWVTVELTVDDNVIWSETWPSDDTWYYFEHHIELPGDLPNVEQKKDVHLRWGTNPGVGGKTFDVVLADGWDLEEYWVPEPATAVLVMLGLGGLLVRRR